MENPTILSRIKDYVLYYIAPIRITKKIHLILNVAWLVLGVVCFVFGIIFAINAGNIYPEDVAGGGFLSFWFIWSLVSGIPFLVRILKKLIKSIKKAAAVGKKIKYTETTVSEVTPLSNIMEVRRTQHNLGGWFGYIWGMLAFIFSLAVLAIVGVAALFARAFLTVKEILAFKSNSQEVQN